MYSGGASTAGRAPVPPAFTTPPRPSSAFQSLNPIPSPHASTSLATPSAPSTATSPRRHSVLAASHDASHDQRRVAPTPSTAAPLRHGRPHSTTFDRRPSSIYNKGSSPFAGASGPSATDLAAAGALEPTEVRSDQMVALVDELQRSSVAPAVIESGSRAIPRPRRREDSAAPSDWTSLGSARGAVGRRSPSPLPQHSREASSASDTSFASPDAAPTPAQLAAPLFPPSGEPGYGDADVTGAPSMARQETLKAIERPWMTSAAIGRGDAPRTPEQLRRAYREGTSPQARRRSVGEGGGAGLDGAGAPSPRQGATTPPPSRQGLLETPRTPPGGIRRLSLIPSPALSPRSARRPLSPADAPPHHQGQVEPAPPPRPPSPSPPPRLAYVPFPASSPAASLAVPDSGTPSRAKSIEEIIALHAPSTYLSSRRPSATSTLPTSSTSSPAAPRAREESAATASSRATGSSIDSLDGELRGTAVAQGLVRARRTSSPSSAAARPFAARSSSALVLDEASPPPYVTPSAPLVSTSKPHRATSPFSSSSAVAADALDSERELARLLKSPRLTRLFTLHRPPNAGLTVSLADVGCATGHPVLVFLGLGAVRYLVALYDELADALGLRLICIDRWGLGRTGEVGPGAQRGFVEWASVVAELVSPEHLALAGSFSVLAHSAGAPYAVAAALHGELVGRVSGSLHLLAPWVSSAADSLAGPYRYLKHVPASVLKAAQAAEWKVQGWRLGKPPALALAPVGWDVRTGRLMNGDELERDEERRSAEAGHGVALLNGGSPTNVRKLEAMYPDGGLIRAGPTATPPPPLSSPAPSSASKSKVPKSGWSSLFGAGGLGSPKRSPGSESADPLEALSSPGSRRSFLSPSPSSANRRASFFGGSSRSSPPPTSDTTRSASQRKLAPSGLPAAPSRRSSLFSISPSPSPTTPSFRRPSLTPSATSSSSHRPDPPPRRERLPSTASTHSHSSAAATSTSAGRERRAIPPAALIDALLRASHAESSSSGGTADLLVLLERTSASSSFGTPSSTSSALRGPGFAYGDVPHICKVWLGDKDDRISLASVRWLERELDRGLAGAGAGPRDKGCEVRVVEGADHSLMASESAQVPPLAHVGRAGDRHRLGRRSRAQVAAADSLSRYCLADSNVMVEVLESIAAEAPRG